jgi:hypothetical protein
VAGLAGIAGAISYSHMRQLAVAHGDTGWHAHAFPLSVDGVEIVASLVLLADRRAGRESGWLPWAALTIGTAASLAANIATADHGTISRIIAGWPAVALLIAVKLLSGILEHRTAVAESPAGACPDRAAVTAGHAGNSASRPHRADSRATRSRPAEGTTDHAGTGTADSDIRAFEEAVRAVLDDLRREGRPLTRDALAARLRDAGYPVRNARLTPLLAAMRAEPASVT